MLAQAPRADTMPKAWWRPIDTATDKMLFGFLLFTVMAPCIIAVSFPMSTARETQRTSERYRTTSRVATPQRGKALRIVVSYVGLTEAERLRTKMPHARPQTYRANKTYLPEEPHQYCLFEHAPHDRKTETANVEVRGRRSA